MRDSTKGILLGVLGTLVLVGAGGLAWTFGAGRGLVLTDGGRIRVPAAVAPVREVLWEPADLLPAWINQGDENYEPRMSGDGRALLFVRGKAGGHADVFVVERTRDGWGEAFALAAINTPGADELGPVLTADGRTLYLYSDRDGGQGGYDLWRVRRTNDPTASLRDAAWGVPENLGPAVNSPFNDYGPAPTPDGSTLFFASNRPKEEAESEAASRAWPATVREDLERRDYDLFAAELTARGIGRAARLDSLSTSSNEGTPAVSPAGDFLYFASDRPGGAGGLDIYRARIRGGAVLSAENLGRPINSAANELDPGLSMGGFALHFSSNRIASREPDSAPSDTAGHPQGPTDRSNPSGVAASPGSAEIGTAGPGAGGEHAASVSHAYAIYSTISREVFRERDPLLAGLDWAAAWEAVWPWMVLLALLALLLYLLRRFLRDEDLKRRWRTLGLLAKCLILSLLLHALLAALFTVWYVAGSVGDLLRRPGGTRVSLVSRAIGADLASQIRGGLTDPTVRPETPDTVRATPDAQSEAHMPEARLDALRVESRDERLAATPAEHAAEARPELSVAIRSETAVEPLAAASPALASPSSASAPPTSEAALRAHAERTEDPRSASTLPVRADPRPATIDVERTPIGESRLESLELASSPDAESSLVPPTAASAPRVPVAPPSAPAPSLATPEARAAQGSAERVMEVKPEHSSVRESTPADLRLSTIAASLPVGASTPDAAFVTPDSPLSVTAATDGSPERLLAATPASGASTRAIPRLETSLETVLPPSSQDSPEAEHSVSIVAERGMESRPTAALIAAPTLETSPSASLAVAPPDASPADSSLAGRFPESTPEAEWTVPQSSGPSAALLMAPLGHSLALALPEAAGTSATDTEAQAQESERIGPAAQTAPSLSIPIESSTPAAALLAPAQTDPPAAHDRSLAASGRSIEAGAQSPARTAPPAPPLPAPIPVDLSSLPIPSLALPEAVEESPAVQAAEPVGTLVGVVRDSETGQPISGARVRLDLTDTAPVVARSNSRGEYRLRVPAGIPDNVAISATAPGYTPASINVGLDAIVRAERRGQPLGRDFDLTALGWDEIPIEEDPEVHHLGNDEFEGAINSQFQRDSEGLTYTAEFELRADQTGASIRAAELVLLAKGAQANNPIRINGRELDGHIVGTPRDGSFGELVFRIPTRWLREGVNTIDVRSVRGSNDLDDFEFVNPRLRLRPSDSRAETPR